MFFTWPLKKPGRKCGVSEDWRGCCCCLGAAAGVVVRGGSCQQVWCYKLNAETTASAEVGKGWEMIMHLHSRESRFLFFFQSSCCRRWTQGGGRLRWEFTWFRPITALTGPISMGQGPPGSRVTLRSRASPTQSSACPLACLTLALHLKTSPHVSRSWNLQVTEGIHGLSWLIFQWFAFATSSSEIKSHSVHLPPLVVLLLLVLILLVDLPTG